MNIVTWVLQIFIALTFAYSGFCKIQYSPKELVARGQTGVEHIPVWLIRVIAILELIGVVGLILPTITNYHPRLASISALCFAAIMIPAAIIHYQRGEYKTVITTNLLIFILCLIIAYLRW